MKSGIAVLPGLLVACLLAGCGKPPAPASPEAPPPTPREKGVPVGVFLPISGAQSAFGRSALAGMRLAVARWNGAGGIAGKPVDLIVRDTESNPDVAARAVRELVSQEHVIAVLGEIASESSMKAAPVAAELGIPMISPGSTHAGLTRIGPGIFRICYADPFQVRVMSKFASSIGVTVAAILYDPDDEYSADLASGFEKDFLERGGKIGAKATYRRGSGDFTSALRTIRDANPEVVFLPAYFAEAAEIIRQARPLGIDQPFIGTDAWESLEFLAAGGEAVNNSYFASHFAADDPSEKTTAFVGAYRTANGGDPLALAALGYDAVNFLADGIRRAGTTEPGALQSALAATAGFDGVTGTITLDADRNPSKPAIVLRVSGGKFHYLESVAP
jgi:branched-chain amino acid transport system substrate-binding protein